MRKALFVALIFATANFAQLPKPGGAGSSPAGAAGGDLSGTYPNPNVSSIGGKAVTLANSLTTVGNFPLTLTQTGTTNVSLPLSGTIPSSIAVFDATAQAANVSGTLYTTPSTGAGTYRASCYVVVTQAATTSSTMPSCQVIWQDNDTNTARQGALTGTSAANLVGLNSFQNGSINPPGGVIQVKASTVIQYLTASYASTGATPMQYAVHIKLEYLGI